MGNATIVQERPGGGKHRFQSLGGDMATKAIKATLSNSYAAGGDACDLSAYFSEILGAALESPSGFPLQYDITNKKLKAHTLPQSIPLFGFAGNLVESQTDFIGPSHVNTTEASALPFVSPAAGRIVGMRAWLATAMAASRTTTLTVRKNTVDTTMTLAITAEASGVTTTNPVTVAAGDRIVAKNVVGAGTTPGGANMSVSLLFEATPTEVAAGADLSTVVARLILWGR